ncbi:hypothetical protein [Paraburkholderia sabiae]|uniref:hypothetical protein n=1 Tax=Paraburkholderia sabiae TaxID=273251 RepID=UPI001CC77F80|nr:hypothetical protein [Paraburkholderia sabiae]
MKTFTHFRFLALQEVALVVAAFVCGRSAVLRGSDILRKSLSDLPRRKTLLSIGTGVAFASG